MNFDLAEMACRLVAQVADLRPRNPVIIAQSLDAVPLACRMADRMQVPLDVLPIRRMGAPFNPEYPIGVVAEHGGVWLNDIVIDHLGLGSQELQEWIQFQMSELQREAQAIRSVLPPVAVSDRTVVLVNPGMVSGGAALAALRGLRRQMPLQVVVAAPIYAPSSIENIKHEVDLWVGGECVRDLNAIHDWYRGFPEIDSQQNMEEVLSMAAKTGRTEIYGREITVESEDVQLQGLLSQPTDQKGWVLFAHGSGSSHRSPRNQRVAERLNQEGFGTLLFDLLTPTEAATRDNVFNMRLLSNRLLMATRWLDDHYNENGLPIGFFGASTGAAAALIAAAELGPDVFAVVSRGGRPDLADEFLVKVEAPTLLIVGEYDETVLALNRMAMQRLTDCELSVVDKATHLFEEPGALEEVQDLASEFFTRQVEKLVEVRGQLGAREKLGKEPPHRSL